LNDNGSSVRKSGESLRKLMDNELAAIAGKYEELVGRLQKIYGIAKRKPVTVWMNIKLSLNSLNRLIAS